MSAPTVPSPDLGLTWRPISLDDIDVWLELMGPHSPARRCGGSSSGAGCIPSGAGVAWRIAVNFEERLPDRAALCAVAGYTAIRWFHDKSRPLGPSAPPVPEVAVPAGLQPPWTDDLDDAVRPDPQRGVRRALGLTNPRRRSLGDVDDRAPIVPSRLVARDPRPDAA